MFVDQHKHCHVTSPQGVLLALWVANIHDTDILVWILPQGAKNLISFFYAGNSATEDFSELHYTEEIREADGLCPKLVFGNFNSLSSGLWRRVVMW
jgi:hypothetical protein